MATMSESSETTIEKYQACVGNLTAVELPGLLQILSRHPPQRSCNLFRLRYLHLTPAKRAYSTSTVPEHAANGDGRHRTLSEHQFNRIALSSPQTGVKFRIVIPLSR
jgi:hypothetical protein